MAVIRVQDFGGEVPRVPARALPATAAQTNSNLLATANEFRPLQGDAVVSPAAVGAKTLYRLQRNASGALHTSDAVGWISEVADKNYVKYQLNDDATERTAVAFNDGISPPRVIDATGQNRLLGVPAPTTKPAAVVNATAQFTQEDALSYAAGTLVPAIEAAVRASLPLVEPDWRQAVPTNYYGAVNTTYPNSQRGVTEPWNVLLPVPEAQAGALTDARLEGTRIGGVLYLPVLARAAAAAVNPTTLGNQLRLILNPVTGSQMFTDAKINEITAEFVKLFDIATGPVKLKRDEITEVLRQFAALANGGFGATLTAASTAYYARADVTASLNSAQDNAAAGIYDACMAFSTPASYFDNSGGS